MFRLAARLRERGLAPHATAGFLNFSEPRIDESVARCIESGAERIVIVPYFLVDGKYVRVDVRRTLQRLRAAHPTTAIVSTAHLGDHALLADLARHRAEEALSRTLGPADAVVLLAHGSPIETANDDVRRVCMRLVAQGVDTTIGYMERNTPTIEEAIREAAGRATTVVAVPYFLQLGRHVRDDLPRVVGSLQRVLPGQNIQLARHLGYHPWLVNVIADRLSEQAGGDALSQTSA